MNETVAMEKVALAAGVPGSSIVLDPNGVDTSTTVSGTAELFEQMVRAWSLAGDPRQEPVIFAVSHFYHLPRVKMAYMKNGWHFVYTVPVRRPLVNTPRYMAREAAALWWYYADWFTL